MRPLFPWRLRTRKLALGERTRVMGVLNVTPDSFSDGGKFLARDRAVAHALLMFDEGADMVDVGGESTRPGSDARVPEAEELRRVLPVIEQVRRERPDALLSIDTYKAAMAATVAELQCGAVLMHMRGRPEEWRSLPPEENLVGRVMRDLAHWTQQALDSGVARERVVLDPGFGFGKNFEENYPLLARFQEFHQMGFPLLAGVSRKSFIGRALAKDGKDAPAGQRLHGSLAAMTTCILKGAHIVRVHDVKASVEAARIADAVLASSV